MVRRVVFVPVPFDACAFDKRESAAAGTGLSRRGNQSGAGDDDAWDWDAYASYVSNQFAVCPPPGLLSRTTL